MLYIKQGYQHKEKEFYIDSIKQRFQKKQAKFYLKQIKTSPHRPQHLFFSPSIKKILKRYQTINIRKSQQFPTSSKHQLPQLNSVNQDKVHKKRWSEIQKEQYSSIRNQINQNKIKIPFVSSSPQKQSKMKSLQKQGDKFRSILIKDDHQKNTIEVKDIMMDRESWIDHIRHMNHQNNKNYRQAILKKNKGYLFPELLSKLPKINTFGEEQEVSLAKSMQIQNKEQQNIFCSRKIKRSQLKLRAQKKGEFSIKRRRFHTLNYQNIHESQIAPWNQPIGHTKSIFY